MDLGAQSNIKYLCLRYDKIQYNMYYFNTKDYIVYGVLEHTNLTVIYYVSHKLMDLGANNRYKQRYVLNMLSSYRLFHTHISWIFEISNLIVCIEYVSPIKL